MPFETEEIPASAKTERVRELIDAIPYIYPERFPRLARILPGPEEQLWVQPYPTTPQRTMTSVYLDSPFSPWGGVMGRASWTVLDGGGTPVAGVAIPEGVSVVEIGEGYVLGVSHDEYDRANVLLFDLIKSNGSSR